MDGYRRYEDGDRMDIDEDRRSTNPSPSLASSAQLGRQRTVLPRIVAADAETPQHPARRQPSYYYHHEPEPRDPNSSIRRERPPYDTRHSFPPAPISPRLYYSERSYDDRRQYELEQRPYEQTYPSRPYSAVESERHPYREPYPRSPREAYAPYPPQRPTSAFDQRYHPRRSLSPPRFRPVNRDPRDRSPNGRYPHYPERPYPPRPYRDEPEHRQRQRSRSDHEMYMGHGRPETPEHPAADNSQSITLEEFAARADRYDPRVGRYAPPSREPPRDSPFTFAHQVGHARGRSEGNGRDTILPPAREILSVSPEMMGRRDEASDRSRSSAEQYHPSHLGRPPPSSTNSVGRPHSPFPPPEEILQSMSLRQRTPPPTSGLPLNWDPMIRSLEASDNSKTALRGSGTHDPQTPHRQHVPSIQSNRTGFPNSGLRSTAPATPPNPRTAQNDSLSFPPRFPGPSLAPLPPPPPRGYTSQPMLQPPTLRPRLEQRLQSSPDQSPPLRASTQATQATKQRDKLILVSTTKEEPSKTPATLPGYRVKSPSRQILNLVLPRLVPVDDNLPAISARRLLVRPPERDPESQRRTKEQNRKYSEWLFESSTNVQRCLTRAVMLCETDVLRAADELCVITHWIVTYMHQLGLSYYSQLRHEMRIAFWWKLNWPWFCLIQTSYNRATRSISPEEIRPFPSLEQLQTDYSQSHARPDTHPDPAVKTEEPTTRSNSPTPKSSDQDTISEPMEDVITSPNDIPPRFQKYWDLAKNLNKKTRWPREMGSEEWIEVGDFLVELGHELARYGLLDLELGFWENEIMHRIGGCLDAWRNREMEVLRLSNEVFEKLGVEEKRVMIAAIRDDDRLIAERRSS